MTNRSFVLACLTPLFIFSIAFLALPLVRLFLVSGDSEAGWLIYFDILRKPRYLNTLVLTVLVSLATTFAALAVSTTAGMFLSRNRFKGRGVLLSIMTLPLAFPGVVIGFLIILLGGRQGLINQITPGHVVFAYSVVGLFLGYLYFSIPRVLLTVMAAAEKLDPALEEAARTLGASPYRVVVDVIIPEPLGGAHRDHSAMTSSLKMNLISMLEELKDTDIGQILYKRKEKIGSYGKFERS